MGPIRGSRGFQLALKGAGWLGVIYRVSVGGDVHKGQQRAAAMYRKWRHAA
jgi:hypothetical protein